MERSTPFTTFPSGIAKERSPDMPLGLLPTTTSTLEPTESGVAVTNGVANIKTISEAKK